MQLTAANRYIYQRRARQMRTRILRVLHRSLSLFAKTTADGVRYTPLRAKRRGEKESKRITRRLSYDGRGPKIFRELYNPRERFVGTKDVYI